MPKQVPTLPSSDRRKKIEAILHASLDLKPEARAAYLDRSCGTDIELKKEIEQLLNSALQSTIAFATQEQASAAPADRPVISSSSQVQVEDKAQSVPQSVQRPAATSGSQAAPARNVMGLSIGDQIGDYEVIGTLGVGGVGEVYKVRHNISHRIEALKVLRAGSAESTERFEREIRVLASLSHPNIAALHTALRQGDHLLMVMEFVEGQTLDAKLRTSGLNLSESMDYIAQVLSALIYAHAKGVIHRDIKPSNIMLAGGNQVKLLDFGLALDSFQPGLTAPGWVMGSLYYMSPEQVLARKVDARSDLYSLGATFYQLLTGKVPIDGESQYTIMTGHLQQQPIVPSLVNSQIPERLSGIVMKALAKEPESRFQSAADFLAALQDAWFAADSFRAPRDPSTRSAAMLGRSTLSSGKVASAPQPSRQVAPISELTPPKQTSPATYSPQVLDRIARRLATYIGPIAKIVVQRAATQHPNMQDLYKKLAEEIESPNDREKFLASLPNRD